MNPTALKEKVTIGLADDHTLLRHGVKTLLTTQARYEVIFDVSDGTEVIQAMKSGLVPDILLLDIHMKKIHGKETAEWVSVNLPGVKIIVLSMTIDDHTILEMIMAGAKGYLPKDSLPLTLFEYIETLCSNDIYFSETITTKLLLSIQRNTRIKKEEEEIALSENEKQFLWYLCQEYTHAEIAEKMFLSPRTIDDYSKKLTKKLNVRSKSGLIVYAVTHKLNIVGLPKS